MVICFGGSSESFRWAWASEQGWLIPCSMDFQSSFGGHGSGQLASTIQIHLIFWFGFIGNHDNIDFVTW